MDFTDTDAESFLNKIEKTCFSVDELATKCNGFSKAFLHPQNNHKKDIFKKACKKIASIIVDIDFQKIDMPVQSKHLSLLVNGWSKFSADNDCLNGVIKIADYIHTRKEGIAVFGFTAQGFANLVNGFSKCSEQDECSKVLVMLAQHIRTSKGGIAEFNAQGFANLVNGFSKCSEQDECEKVLVMLAKYITEQGMASFGFNNQHLANLANGFSKCIKQDEYEKMLVMLAKYITEQGMASFGFTAQHLANLANGFTKCAKQQVCSEALKEIAQYILDTSKDGCKIVHQSMLLEVTQLLKALVKDQKMSSLLLARAEQITTDEQQNLVLFQSEDLETLANFTIALQPLLETHDAQQNQRVLQLLIRVWPAIQRKLTYYQQVEDDPQSSDTQEAFQSRYFVLSLEQLLKSYHKVPNVASILKRLLDQQNIGQVPSGRELAHVLQDNTHGLGTVGQGLAANVNLLAQEISVDLFEVEGASRSCSGQPSKLNANRARFYWRKVETEGDLQRCSVQPSEPRDHGAQAFTCGPLWIVKQRGRA